MRPSIFRFVPAVLVMLLLSFIGLRSNQGVAGATPAPLPTTDDDCTSVQKGTLHDTETLLFEGSGVCQPIGTVANISACSTMVRFNYWSSYRLSLQEYDPLTLAPDPSTTALRTLSASVSLSTYTLLKLPNLQPVVLRAVDGVAEGPRPNTCLELALISGSPFYALWNSNEPTPAPSLINAPLGQSRSVMPGPHPVLSHGICAREDHAELRVLQSVMTTNASITYPEQEYTQRFRVPVDCSVQWIELATGSPWVGSPVGQISLYDADGQNSPPLVYGTPIATAPFLPNSAIAPSWQGHDAFTGVVVLEAGHDYWLSVTGTNLFRLSGRMLNGAEGPSFTSNIGPLFKRLSAEYSPVEVTDRTLSFRIIGTPAAPVTGIPNPPAIRNAFALAIGPNPSRGATLVRWEHAAGALRIDVLDARGRRVAHAATAPGARGSWTWNGTDEAGHALPAAVYFVRATDDADRVATGRIVLVR